MRISPNLKSLLSKLTAIILFSFATCGFILGQSYMIDIKRDSARSDIRTGGVIEKTKLSEGEGKIKLTVNVPAFEMTLWQNGKEVKIYKIGVGMKDFPIYVGLRKIKHVIWNPVWIPPNSEWVSPSLRGKIIKPTDPRNPLGKIKIPLGYGYLIHQAKGPQDLGNLVSHGCVRVMRNDLYDLSNKFVSAHSVPITEKEISTAKRTKKTLVIELEETVPIEITYDTLVIKSRKLHIYPDVYSFKKNTVKNLREELTKNGIDASEISDETLKRALGKAKAKKQYVIGVDKLRAGEYLNGKVIPVLKRKTKSKRKKRGRRRRKR